ncbi:MAG: FAD binding domain-containing protein [Pyrobaculum sp.]
MYPPEFNYVRPATMEGAVKALSRDGAMALAGGQSLVPLLKLRLAYPTLLVDINRLPLRYVKYGGEVQIGALTRHYELEDSPCGLLSQTARRIGDVQVRSVGTVGGSLAHGDPRGDWPVAMLAAGAVVKAVGPSGGREIEAEKLYVGPYSTTLARGELITEVRLRCPERGAYVKFSPRRNDFALAAVAVAAWVKGGHIDEIKIAAAGAAEMPVRLRKVEAFLQGAPLNREIITEAAEIAKREAAPPYDFRASVEYRRALVATALRRALEKI